MRVDRDLDRAKGVGAGAGVRALVVTAVAAAVQVLCATPAMALELDVADGDLKIRWDNSVKYSAGFRVKAPSDTLIGNPNQDDGDRNFSRKGLISNRVDVLSDLDIVYRNDFGARVSGAAWYDGVYNRATHNDSPGTYNAASVPASEFPDATRKQHGRKAELLDAFVFGKGNVDDMRWSLRAGKHTLLWGETLFFGANGIAGAQAPVDLVKLLSVPGSQFKEIIRPVGQLSGSFQVMPDLQIGGYYQYRWERTRLAAVGSYFSTQDLFDAGGERFLLGGPVLTRSDDLEASNSGQYGLQLRFRLPDGGTDFGVYAIRFHEKTPQLYLNFPLGTYGIAYHEGVRAFGVSASRTFGDVNLATEVSVRHNASLVNDGVINFSGMAPSQDNPMYPIGKTAHANLSAIWAMPSNPLFNEATLLGEVAWNRRLSVSNGYAMAINSERDAWGLRMQVVPTYRQVFSGMDLEVPFGLGYNAKGKSQAVSFFNGGVHKGGDLSLGLNGNYLNTWKLGLNYTHYIGEEGTTLDSTGHFTFKQSLHDRDFVSLTVQTTF